MLDWNDPRWQTLKGGYRVLFDPRPMLKQLEASPHDDALWSEFIGDLYHQGDVGEASYAAVPELLRLIVQSEVTPWQPITLVAFIEEARTSPQNPVLPDWLAPAYSQSVDTLARYCLQMLPATTEPLAVSSMLAFLTLWKGMRAHYRAFTYSESDLTYYFDEC
jgi:hypothetical protein